MNRSIYKVQKKKKRELKSGNEINTKKGGTCFVEGRERKF
jgi:hypothetical protein